MIVRLRKVDYAISYQLDSRQKLLDLHIHQQKRFRKLLGNRDNNLQSQHTSKRENVKIANFNIKSVTKIRN